MNIVEIIKKAPKDHVYWCTLMGECRVVCIDDYDYPIRLESGNEILYLTKSGRYSMDTPDAECVLFPSKDNRDWADFERELDGKPEEKKPLFHSKSESFDGSVEMVSIPDRPMMAAVICAGLLAGGCKDKGAALVNKALHLADLILDETETKEETK